MRSRRSSRQQVTAPEFNPEKNKNMIVEYMTNCCAALPPAGLSDRVTPRAPHTVEMN